MRTAVSIKSALSLLLFVGVTSVPAVGDSFFFSTGAPDGKMGTLSRPGSAGLPETETADDFVLTQATRINQATFTGLIPTGASIANVTDVEMELYHIFPTDSSNPPCGQVPTRVNSPSDNQFLAFDSKAGDIKVSITVLNPNFTVANTVVNGIHPSPNQLTGGEGPATGQEVQFTITFSSAFVLAAGHDFFRPEVELSDGNFLWLSAPRSGAPFPDGTPDLQTWIRNESLSPDWLRIGTDITGQGPFNASFSLSGDTVPEPSSYLLLGTGLLFIAMAFLRRREYK